MSGNGETLLTLLPDTRVTQQVSQAYVYDSATFNNVLEERWGVTGIADATVVYQEDTEGEELGKATVQSNKLEGVVGRFFSDIDLKNDADKQVTSPDPQLTLIPVTSTSTSPRAQFDNIDGTSIDRCKFH